MQTLKKYVRALGLFDLRAAVHVVHARRLLYVSEPFFGNQQSLHTSRLLPATETKRLMSMLSNAGMRMKKETKTNKRGVCFQKSGQR